MEGTVMARSHSLVELRAETTWHRHKYDVSQTESVPTVRHCGQVRVKRSADGQAVDLDDKVKVTPWESGELNYHRVSRVQEILEADCSLRPAIQPRTLQFSAMSANHLFSALTSGGVYFNKRKYGSDLALFNKGEGKAAAGQHSEGSSAAAACSSSSSTKGKNKSTEASEQQSEQSSTAPQAAEEVPLTTQQRVLFVGSEEGKLHAIRQLVLDGEVKPPVLLYVQSDQRARELYSELAYDNLRVDVLHTDRSSAAQRAAVIERFRTGEVWVLIVTDITAKGVDTKANLVINYDFPQGAQRYLRRVAKAGRAGKEGKVVTFFTEEDRPFLKIVVNAMKTSGVTDIPAWLLALPTLSKKERRKLKTSAPERKDVKEAAGTSKFGQRGAQKRAEMVMASKRRAQRGLKEDKAEQT
ncbi:RNA-dependent ATPase rok1 [Tilletia horrida]|uniref:RNA helicase n=1 Tax=Tilletia horrida TaxID=155126 RepID=A0AAN6GQ63_9BASI|nr:RNA-dependent ATPase rok1 [Tilletia horrida]KAK0564175.1 RNA-dependent ATPase rok1 [Tilletia horrida]